jgi:hypothetical protein
MDDIFVEWGVRWHAGSFSAVDVRDTEAEAREFLAVVDGSGTQSQAELVHRTVTRTEWQAAADSLPGA